MAGTAAALTVVSGGLLTVGRWFIRKEVQMVKAELRPSHGDTFRDHFDRRMDNLDDRYNLQQEQINDNTLVLAHCPFVRTPAD